MHTNKVGTARAARPVPISLVRDQILKAHVKVAVCLPLQILLLHVGEDAVLLFRRGLLGIEPSVEPVEGGGEFSRILMGEVLDCHNDFFGAVNLNLKELSHNKRLLSMTFLNFFLGEKCMQFYLAGIVEICKTHHCGRNGEIAWGICFAD